MPKLALPPIVHVTNEAHPILGPGPGPYAYQLLSDPGGLTQFGAFIETLPPGSASGHRHWHEGEDEMVIIIAGEAVLVDDDGETLMQAGDVASFPKNDGNGHVLINRSDVDCVFVAVGQLAISPCYYPDIDMIKPFGAGFKRKDGSDF